MAKIRPRITTDEWEIVQQYRAIKEESNDLGIDHQDVKHGWLKSKNASLFFANPDFFVQIGPLISCHTFRSIGPLEYLLRQDVAKST